MKYNLRDLLLTIILFLIIPLFSCEKFAQDDAKKNSLNEKDSGGEQTISHQTDNGVTTKNSSVNIFEKYLSSLDKIPLPFMHSSVSTVPNISNGYFDLGFQKFKLQASYKPLGLLYYKKNVAIIEYSIADNGHALFVITYNAQGNKVDSLSLYSKSGANEKVECTEFLNISKEFKIQVNDTTYFWNVDERGDRIGQIINKKSGSTVYQISDNGKILKGVSK